MSPDGCIVVGYVPTAFGSDALNVAIALAKGRPTSLQVVMVGEQDSPFSGIYPHDRGYVSIVEESIAEWINHALATVPDDTPAYGRYVRGRDIAVALSNVADALDADLIVVGTREAQRFSRMAGTTVTLNLIKLAQRPIVLAPRHYAYGGPAKRINCIIGGMEGAPDVLADALERSQLRGIPLRVVRVPDEKTVAGVVEKIDSLLAGQERVEVVEAPNFFDAAISTDWQLGDVAMIGTNRLLAQPSSFLATPLSTVTKTIPVPAVVTPPGYKFHESLEKGK